MTVNEAVMRIINAIHYWQYSTYPMGCKIAQTTADVKRMKEVYAEAGRFSEGWIAAHVWLIESITNELLSAANADAARLAAELEGLYARGVCWEEPGESSPALIMHKERVGG